MTIPEFENLVFEGGGVRGIAFTGAIKYLEDEKILQNIKRFAGSSAGAWTATLLAIGLNADQCKSLVMETDFRRFQDSTQCCQPYSFIKNAGRLLWYYAWHRGDRLYSDLGQTLQKYTGNQNITFKEIYEKYGKDLVITATNVNKAQTIYFHRFSYPDFPVRTAVRASMAIPLYFKPVIFNGDYLVDGGFLNNYPIDIFDDHTYFPCDSAECSQANYQPNSKTLGLKLVGPDEKPDELIFHGELDTSRVRFYIMSLLDCMSWKIERSGIKPGYWERTVIIPTFEIKTTAFDLTGTDKIRLYTSGYDSIKNFFADSQISLDLENKPYFLPNINSWNQSFVSSKSQREIKKPRKIKKIRKTLKKRHQ